MDHHQLSACSSIVYICYDMWLIVPGDHVVGYGHGYLKLRPRCPPPPLVTNFLRFPRELNSFPAEQRIASSPTLNSPKE
uniref:Secreted protein n=1 Tax=Steinernema glaseri TaxID=37863 RepID=A0A1I7YBM4_9BILA